MSKISRRNFLKATGAVAAIAAASHFETERLEAERLRLPVGLQLYSVRNQLPTDFAGTLAQVRSAGYTVVEAAGYFDRPAADYRHAVDAAGLRCVSTHHPLNVLVINPDQWPDYGHTIGLRVYGLLVVGRNASRSGGERSTDARRLALDCGRTQPHWRKVSQRE